VAAEIVNLRKARKARDRLTREAEAAGNRTKFGRTRAEREASVAREALETRRLDGHRLQGSAGTRSEEPEPGTEGP
jgi:hypothetical protein